MISFASVLILLVVGDFANAQNSFIEPVTKSPGLFFDYISQVRFYDDYLHVLSPVDISYVKPHIENINSVFGTVRYLCQQTDVIENVECHNIFEPLKSRLDDIVKDFSAMSHLIPTKIARSPWIGGIGTVLKQIFGTLDNDDAIKYDSAIKALSNKDKKLGMLLKENVLLTKSSLQYYNETLTSISINEARLNTAVDSMSLEFKNLSVASNKNFIRSKINQICNSLSSSLLTLSFKIEDLQNAIMFAKSHVLHSSILTPKQLFNELVENSRYLPRSKELPVILDLDNIHIILEISKINVYFKDNKIIFVMKIPLLDHKIFNLYKTIPVPVPHNAVDPKTFTLLIPTNDYICLSKDKFTYTFLDSINSCVKLTLNSYICNKQNEFSTNSNPSCETEIMLKALHDTLPEQCNPKFIHGDIDIWQKLENNRFIFVQSETAKLIIECGSNTTETNILGTGILNLLNNCVAICNNIEMHSDSNFVIFSHEIKSDFNIINNTCCNVKEFMSRYSNIPPIRLSNINLEKLKNLDTLSNRILPEIYQTIDEPVDLLEYHSSYPILTYCILILIFFVIFYIIFVKFLKSFRNEPPSTPPNDSGIELDIPIPSPRVRST